MRTPTRFLAALLLPLALVAACGDDTDDEGVATDPTDGGAEDGGPAPTAPDDATPGGQPGDVFVEIAFVGGFVPVGFDFRSVPNVTIYADGTVVVPGASPAIFPGPAVSPLAIGTLDQEEMDEVLAEVAAAGLLADEAPDPGDNPFVADAATTRITVVVDGQDTVVEAYALDLPVDPSSDGADEAQIEVRARLSEFVTTISDAATSAADEIYEPTGYRVLATEPFETDPSITPNTLAWPGELPQPVLDECVAITGDAAPTLTATLDQASEITRWTTDAGEVTLSIRPMLPHEDAC